jgi:hypothetical protein
MNRSKRNSTLNYTFDDDATNINVKRYIGAMINGNQRNQATNMIGICILINDNLAITCASNIINQNYKKIKIYHTSDRNFDEANCYSV